MHKLPMKPLRPREVVTSDGIGSTDLTSSELRGMDDDNLVEEPAQGQGGAVQPPVPVGHRPAGQPRPAPGGQGHRRIYTVMRERELGIGPPGDGEPDLGMSEERTDRRATTARPVRVGRVSDKMDKTVVVEVEDRVKHPSTARSCAAPSKVKATTTNESASATRVLIMETRPLRSARWRVVEILEVKATSHPPMGPASHPHSSAGLRPVAAENRHDI